jgi:DNA-binding transcriptional LysR family regulator
MPRDRFHGLSEFLAVADHRSFTAAAAALGVTPTAVSQTIRAIETQQRIALFTRTTRCVAMTEAGHALVQRLRPAAQEIAGALEMLGGFRDRPSGHLRLTVPRMAMPLVIEPLLPRFRKAYPDITIEVAVDDAAIDISGEGFDAGIRIGEAIEKDMIAVRLTRDILWTVVGSPRYFARSGRPLAPEELTRHEALRYRYPASGVIYRWEFQRAGRLFGRCPGRGDDKRLRPAGGDG